MSKGSKRGCQVPVFGDGHQYPCPCIRYIQRSPGIITGNGQPDSTQAVHCCRDCGHKESEHTEPEVRPRTAADVLASLKTEIQTMRGKVKSSSKAEPSTADSSDEDLEAQRESLLGFHRKDGKTTKSATGPGHGGSTRFKKVNLYQGCISTHQYDHCESEEGQGWKSGQGRQSSSYRTHGPTSCLCRCRSWLLTKLIRLTDCTDK